MGIAPDVTLYIAQPASPLDLLSTTQWMASQGVTVINHSVSWLWQGPGDGTSIRSDSALAAVDTAVSAGITWVNAAGDEALSSWTGGYLDPDGDRWLSFRPGSEINAVQLQAGELLVVQCRWEDTWGAAARDLDLYLWDSSRTTVLGAGDSLQQGVAGQVPLEVLTFISPATATYHLTVQHFGGAAPSWIQVQGFTRQPLAFATAGSIANPAESANPGLMAVGAAAWSSPQTIEPFSSRGPTRDNRVKPTSLAPTGETPPRGATGRARARRRRT